MSQFSRRSRWLNFIFPASKVPTLRDPASRSDDVSLVQPYDGSGWPLPEFTSVLTNVLSVAGANVQTLLLEVPEGEVFRLMAISAFKVVGVNANLQPFVRDDVSSPNVAVALATEQQNGTPFSGNPHFELNTAIVIPGGLALHGQHNGGDAATIISWNFMGYLAPAGTVFYC